MLGVVEGDEREKRTMMCTILDVCCVSLKQDKYYGVYKRGQLLYGWSPVILYYKITTSKYSVFRNHFCLCNSSFMNITLWDLAM